MTSLHKDNTGDEPLFAFDDDQVDHQEREKWKILVVDDEPDVLAVTRMVLSSFTFEDRGVEIHTAESFSGAVDLFKDNHDYAMAFVDVVMETDHAGLDLVRFVREELGNNDVQIVLRTGQPGYAPEMQVILEYGINDYRTKTEMDNTKTVTAVVSALRNYKNIVEARRAAQEHEMAKAINESKALFFAQISHDFRAPLNGILGFCQLLMLSPLETEQLEQVTLIQQSGRHLLSLVNDILDLSKSDAGKMELEAIPVDISGLVDETCKLLRTQLKPGVTLDLNLAQGIPRSLLGDPVRIKQILHNLISNAIKFTEHGSVRVRVSAHPPSSQPGMHALRFDVADSGIGIPKDRIDSLFGVFEQADSSITRSYGGTGLGLAICKQLAELMQGGITVVSEEGKGSTFTVTIQLPESAIEPSMSKERVPIRSVDQPDAKATVNVLVVDDDPINRMLLERILRRREIQVTVAENGIEANSVAQQQRFDLVFMDCLMPQLDGYGATKQLRGVDAYKNVPIVALTGLDTEGDMQKCFDAGMSDFLQKPMNLEAINAMVDKWLILPDSIAKE